MMLKPILQDRNKRHIRGGHGVIAKPLLSHPGASPPLDRFGLTRPIAAGIAASANYYDWLLS
jgi:hypothetical protein